MFLNNLCVYWGIHHVTFVERLGTGKFQRRMVIALGMCAASDAMEVLLLSFLSIVVQHEYNVSPNEGSLLTSSKSTTTSSIY